MIRLDDLVFIQKLWRMSEVTRHAVIMIKTLFPGQKLRFGAEMPFTHHEGVVSMGFAMLGDSDFIRMQSEKPVGSSVRIDSHVESTSLRISSGQKSGPGR